MSGDGRVRGRAGPSAKPRTRSCFLLLLPAAAILIAGVDILAMQDCRDEAAEPAANTVQLSDGQATPRAPWPEPPPGCPTVEIDEREPVRILLAEYLVDLPSPARESRAARVVVEDLPPGARWHEAEGGIEFQPTFIQGGRTYVSRVSSLSQEKPWSSPLCIQVRDSVSPPEPQIVDQVAGEGFTRITLSQTTDDFLDSPGHAGRTVEAVLSVPDVEGDRSEPLRVDLHGFHSPLRGHGISGTFALFPHDPEDTYWWGYSANLPGGRADACEAPDYTQRRVLHLIDWVLRRYPAVDPDRVWVFGNSMGGAGAATIGLRYARHFAFVDARRGQLVPRNHRPARARQLAELWGRPGAMGEDACSSAWDQGDLTAVLRDSFEARQQYLNLRHGKDDAVVHFGALVDPSPLTGLSFVGSLRRLRIGHRVIWDESGHGDLDPVLGEVWWSTGWQAMADPITTLRRDMAFPAFSTCSVDDEIGTSAGNGTRGRDDTTAFAGDSRIPGDTGWDGDLAGAWNRYLRWDSRAIVDRPDRLEIPIRVVDGEGDPPPAPGYPPTGDRLEHPIPVLVDVTPRRIQSFLLQPGEVVRWSFGERKGKAIADDDGTVILPALDVDVEWKVLVLERTVLE